MRFQGYAKRRGERRWSHDCPTSGRNGSDDRETKTVRHGPKHATETEKIRRESRKQLTSESGNNITKECLRVVLKEAENVSEKISGSL